MRQQLVSQAVSSFVAVVRDSGRRRWTVTETEKNWIRAAAIVVGCDAVFALLWAAEMGLGRWNSSIRLVLNPAETAMRYVGISHFLVATLFLATSRRMRTARSWGSFAGFLAVGVMLCIAYGRIKTVNALLASALFFAYFLVHSMRDDVFFYFANGDAPASKDPESLREILRWSPWLFLGVAGTLLTALVGLDLVRVAWLSAALVGVPQAFRPVLGLLPAVVAGVAIVQIRRRWRAAEAGERAAAFFRANRAIFLVFTATFLVLVAGKGYAIVTLHVVAWYVFSLAQMKKRPPPDPAPPRGSWVWLRATAPGFQLLHIGSTVLLVGVGAVWAYGYGNSPALTPVALLLDTNAFAYWTILHVTVSFSH